MRGSLVWIVVALAAFVGGCSTADGAEREIEVRIRHSEFIPTEFEVDPGTTVRFVIVNTDPIDHEFIVGDARVQRIHEEGTEAHHGAKPGEISVAANSTATTTYTFTESGRLIFGCHLPGHYDYGMRGTIEVR